MNERRTYTLNPLRFTNRTTHDLVVAHHLGRWANPNRHQQPVNRDDTYASGPNNFTISATATDDVGTYSANTVAVQINHVAPTLAITGDIQRQRSLALHPESLRLRIRTHTISSWTINWGDGHTQTVTGDPSSVTHTYAQGPNNFTITATATDDVATYSAGTLAVHVNHVAPTLTISARRPSMKVPPTHSHYQPPKSAQKPSAPGLSTGAMEVLRKM